MIECITCETSHLFDDALASQYRLRYRSFLERQNYDTFSFRGMEYDRYDTPASTYLVWRDDQRVVRGASRLNPTDRPYMLKDLWPDMVSKQDLPSSISVWEGTRFCVDKDLASAALRREIISEIVCGYLEYGLSEGIDLIVGVMPTLIWRSVFVKSGWQVDYLGEEKVLADGSRVIAGELSVSVENLEKVRQKTGITGSILVR